MVNGYMAYYHARELANSKDPWDQAGHLFGYTMSIFAIFSAGMLPASPPPTAAADGIRYLYGGFSVVLPSTGHMTLDFVRNLTMLSIMAAADSPFEEMGDLPFAASESDSDSDDAPERVTEVEEVVDSGGNKVKRKYVKNQSDLLEEATDKMGDMDDWVDRKPDVWRKKDGSMEIEISPGHKNPPEPAHVKVSEFDPNKGKKGGM